MALNPWRRNCSVRGELHGTTAPDKRTPCLLDKVNRQFRVPAPNMLRDRSLRGHRFKPSGRRFHPCRHPKGFRLARTMPRPFRTPSNGPSMTAD